MTNKIEILFGITALILAIVSFGFYRRVQRKRVVRVNKWIQDFLTGRYGELPEDLTISCTDDQLWPVLVTFDRAVTKTRHMLQFMCSGLTSRFALATEKEHHRAPAI